MKADYIPLKPQFIKGNKGNLFSLFYPPEEDKTIYLFLPPFAEELNRCRVMVAMQARQLAAQGFGCLLLDYYGTGDSEGDFSETHWEQWRQDIDSAYQWLIDNNYQNISLWGLRLGALLALNEAVELPQRYQSLVLWQPVLDGKQFLTQFLRIRIAMLMDRGLKKESTQNMRACFEQGENIEVAGYEITPLLANSIDGQKMLDYSVSTQLPKIHWFEAAMNEEAELSFATQKLLNSWKDKGIDCQAYTYTGPFFWQLHERELTPELLKKTNEALFI